MNKSYEKPWFTLEDYLETRPFNKPKTIVPPAFSDYFSSAEEMWEMLTVRIQENINLYFNGVFDLLPFEFFKDDYKNWIKLAIFTTFEAIMNGRMPFYSNVELVFTNNNQNYSLTNDFRNDNNAITDMFPVQAIKWLNMTNLRRDYKFKNWQEAFDYWVNQLDPDHLITFEEIEKLFNALDLTNTNLLKTIQETLENYETDNETWKTQTLEMINNRISVTEIAKEITTDKDAMIQIGQVTAKTIAESDELVRPLTDVATIAANNTATNRLNAFVSTAGSNENLVNNVAAAINQDIADIPKMKEDIEAAETKEDHTKSVEDINKNIKNGLAQKMSFVAGGSSYQTVSSSSSGLDFNLTGAQFTNLTANDLILFNIYGIEKEGNLHGRFNQTVTYWPGTSDIMLSDLFTAPSLVSTSLERIGYVTISKPAVNMISLHFFLVTSLIDTIRVTYTIFKGAVQ